MQIRDLRAEWPLTESLWGLEWHSCHLWSLYAMLQFSAAQFADLMIILGRIENLFKERKEHETTPLNEMPKASEAHKKYIGDLQVILKQLGLKVCIRHVARMENNVSKYTIGDLRLWLKEMQNRVIDELDSEQFLHIAKEKAPFYSDPRTKFGQIVITNFPSLIMEIEESGKSYATGRNTACVFHLMRILEGGLKTTANALAVPTSTNRSWDAILKKIIDAHEQQHPRDEWTDFYVGLVARLYAVKDAWRNPTMHVERSYNEEESLEVFNNVSSFMRHLATKLKETP